MIPIVAMSPSTLRPFVGLAVLQIRPVPHRCRESFLNAVAVKRQGDDSRRRPPPANVHRTRVPTADELDSSRAIAMPAFTVGDQVPLVTSPICSPSASRTG